MRDFDLELIAPNGTTVARSEGVNNTAELINYTVDGTGQYTIKLTCYGGGIGTGRLALAWW